ncbi:MAG: L-lactate dehydrogenase [Alphaproteobacteria bacterium]|nr:L-lactate dehydrogenase [Alphaproteobacteria bacterium]
MKIGIIGSGFVGSAAAFALVWRGVAHELVLVDINREKAKAEALDISHALPFASYCNIWAGDYADLEGADVIIVTAGVNQKPGETREDLLARNQDVFKQIAAQIIQYAADAVILIASNPVDVMTAYIIKESKLSPHRVFGTGTILDTARFRTLLAQHLHLAPQSVHAHVIGEHGDSEVLIWSSAKVGTVSVDEFAKMTGRTLTTDDKNYIDDNVRNSAYHIIEGKGATYYGIAGGITRICEAIKNNENAILNVTSLQESIGSVKDVCLSLPTIINRNGIRQVLYPPISENERKLLIKSAEKIKFLSS